MFKLKLSAFHKWLLVNSLIILLWLTILRVILYAVYLYKLVPKQAVLSSFWLGVRFDARIVAVLAILLFLLGLFPKLNPFKQEAGKKLAKIMYSLAAVWISFFYVIDFANFAYLLQRLNANLINYLYDASISLTMIWQTYPVIKLLLLIALLTWGLVKICFITFKKINTQSSANTKPSKTWLGGLCTFLLFAFCIFGQFNQYPLRWSDAFRFNNDYAAYLSLNPFQSFFSTLSFRHHGYDSKKLKQGYADLQPIFLWKNKGNDVQFSRQTLPEGLPKNCNVVLVICESFSSYKSSLHGNPLQTTPFFKSIADSGLLFERCFTPTYGTARGVWATLTGIPDVELPKTASRNPNAVSQNIIINQFKNYQKFYFIGGSTSWANIRGILSNNIDSLRLYEQDDYNAPKIDVWGVSDKHVFLGANQVLKQQKQPFFAVIQTADNHRPYTIPDEDKASFKLVNYPKDTLEKYGFGSNEELNAFRYTDYCFEVFMKEAKQSSYFNNTLFVFVGDHGIPGSAGRMLPACWTLQSLTSEHVPLLFYYPSQISAQKISHPVSQIDILPSIATFCNIPFVNTTLGRNVLPFNNNQYPHYAFIFDPENKRVGIINDSIYFSKNFNQAGLDKWYSIIHNNPPQLTIAQKQELEKITDAYFEASKYLILNNKKLKP